MILRPDRVFFRIAVICVVAAALGGCGRKGPLDLPPGAAIDPTADVPAETRSSPSFIGSMSGSASSRPVAPVGPKKRIPLDVLLD